jgi:hypothetical protein
VAGITKSPVKVVYDAIAADASQRAGWEIIAANGVLVVSLPVVLSDEERAEGEKEGKRAVFTFGNINMPERKEFADKLFAALNQWLENGEIKVNAILCSI